MKNRKRLKKAAAAALAATMALTVPSVPVSAGIFGGGSGISGFWSSVTGFFDRLLGGDDTEQSEDSQQSAESGSTETEVHPGTPLKLISDETTVSAATDLRASTYQTMDSRAQDIVYFPVTLFNYDRKTINQKMAEEEAEVAYAQGESSLDYWKGLYFSGGNPAVGDSRSDQMPTSVELTTGETQTEVVPEEVRYNEQGNYSQYEDGTYYLDEALTQKITDISCDRSGTIWHRYRWTVRYEGGTWESRDDSITIYHPVTSGETFTVSSNTYAGYNYWTGNEGAGENPVTTATGTSTRAYIYSGLAEDQLDSSGNIQFTVPDAGIFDVSDRESKEVYTNVGLPFEFDQDSGMYTFDSDEMAAYFEEEPESGTNLTYSAEPAAYHWTDGNSYNTGFFPFNPLSNNTVNARKGNVKNNNEGTVSAHPITGKNSYGEELAASGDDAADFWFGMTANVPFTMNPNGKITASDTSEDAEFTFSGDDDVWVFIDGQLVLDLGGIHDSVSGSFNFAENTITMWSTNDSYKSGDVAGTYESGSEKVSQEQLFNELNEDGTVASQGKLNTDINTFCATSEHTLTIYYLERGGGLSNSKIQFNLPQRDSLSVSKVVSSTDSEGAPLTSEQQAAVSNQDFTYTLYDRNGEAMGRQAYSLYSTAGTFLGNGTTDKNGRFTIRNGQTARFYGLTFTEENTYYVVENEIQGYETPKWDVRVTGNEGYGEEPESGYTSDKITINGNEQSTETVSFTCTNTVTHVSGTSLTPQDDQIVIDYGLPVEIDVLVNDSYTGGTLSLISVEGAEYGTAAIQGNKIVYTLNRQLTDVETLTYTAKVESEIAADSKEATAQVKIIPATSMYYEENFIGSEGTPMITYTNGKSSGWKPEGAPLTDCQEPGVVGDPADSPYGSDAAYLDNQTDSYGTSMYVDTTEGAAQFSYTFTGTGTTVFARTSPSTGYLQIKLTDANGSLVKMMYRDTIILGDSLKTLYHVPIYNVQGLDYGTYTLTITVAKAGTHTATEGGAGKDFYLDGIQVSQPMATDSEEYGTAEAAYLRDAESNITVEQVRDKLLADYTEDGEDGLVWADGKGFVTFTDTNGEVKTAAEYASIGPKTEVYLNAGQSISFSLGNWDPDNGHVYLGIKAPQGSGQVKIGNNTLDIQNTVDCYYDISDSSYGTVTEIDGVRVVTYTITAAEDSLISVTNIKVTGLQDFAIMPGEDVDGDGGGDIVVAAAPEQAPAPDGQEPEENPDQNSADSGEAAEIPEAAQPEEEAPAEEQESGAETIPETEPQETEESTEEIPDSSAGEEPAAVQE